jgi:hypothetical protein
MSKDNFNIVINYVIKNKYYEEMYYLIMNILASRDLCHYIINNQYVLDIITVSKIFDNGNKTFINKYMPIIKYIMSYSWLTLYMEENVKGKNINIKDRFMFNIQTASLLPNFPFNIKNPCTSPYLPIMISNNALNIEKNCHAVLPVNLNEEYNCDNNYGVCNLIKFKERLNLFFSNTEHNLLEGVDFNGIGITGSCIACCLPNFNPLQLNFKDFNSFKNEFYKNSDLDIISNLPIFDFVDKAKHIVNILKKNIKKKLNKDNFEINLNLIKTVFISINDDYIQDNYNCTINEIDLSDINIRQKFYDNYLEKKKQFHKDNINKYPIDKYKEIYEVVSIENMSIAYKSKIYYQCNENVKFKILNPYTKVIEYFQIQGDDVFKTISTFHLPIVRAYYNGDTIYMTPSCVSACMTLYNIDIKYFSSTNCPIEIINKYRQRGFGIFLNKKEKLKLMEYSFQEPNWKNKYNIENKYNIRDILKPFSIKHKFYNNSEINNDNEDRTNIYINGTVQKVIINNTLPNWLYDLYKIYKSKKLTDIDFANKSIIDYKGTLIPLDINYISIAFTLL